MHSDRSSFLCGLNTLCDQDNERKDKLVAIAMAARHEFARHATHYEQLAASVRTDFDSLQVRMQQTQDELAVIKLQLEAAYGRVDTASAELEIAVERETALRDQLEVAMKAGATRELELKNEFDQQQTALQQRLDKTKRELMDVVSNNLSLDSRLRKTQEKLARATASSDTTAPQ